MISSASSELTKTPALHYTACAPISIRVRLTGSPSFQGKFASRRGEGGEEWRGGPLWSPAWGAGILARSPCWKDGSRRAFGAIPAASDRPNACASGHDAAATGSADAVLCAG